ncbi:Transposable element P transposase [Orchesella cincta]|uniref:Transposable element P transposase n=1 Tax=Orchesella cincta TaxID=48709 RepID=A0A1D2MGI6_ORCCI|nr:Transposable element P transposase [Orchesella cincta]
MPVFYGLHIFSNSTAVGLKTYRDIACNPLFKNSEPTEKFTKIMNDLFDSCNARAPPLGIRPNDKKYTIISEFLSSMNATDTFASPQTLVSLQVSLSSTLNLVDYLCSTVGYDYALTGKFNQDPLEKFFGLVRSSGGEDCHPTVTSFSHIFRLLSVYFPTSRAIKGNVSVDEDYSIVSTSCLETLKELKIVAKSQKQKADEEFEESILGKLYRNKDFDAGIDVNLQISTDHSYISPPIDRCIVYNFAGFLAYKAKTFTTCESCIATLIESKPTSSYMLLTSLKDFGGLKHPSEALFRLVFEKLEPVLQHTLSS